MGFLLADAAKLSQNLLVRGVIETMITESALLKYLPFLTVSGSGVTYNQEQVPASAEWHAVNGGWTSSELTVVQQTAALKILGGDADVDAFLQQTYSNRNDIQALVVQNKAKALAYAFTAAFFNGDTATDPNQFDGLTVLAGPPVVSVGGLDATHRAWATAPNGGLLTLDQIDATIDAVRPGKPDVLFMSKRTRRRLSALRRNSGTLLEVSVDGFGSRAVMYDGIPVETDENLSDSETQGSSAGICSSIYAVKFGYGVGVCGLQNGGIQAIPVGPLESKDALRTRLKWYCGLAVFRPIAFVRLAGIKDS